MEFCSHLACKLANLDERRAETAFTTFQSRHGGNARAGGDSARTGVLTELHLQCLHAEAVKFLQNSGVEGVRFAGREARLRLLGWRGELPIQPHIAAPPQAPGIHLVVRGLTPDVFSGVEWFRLTEEQGDNVLIYSWLTNLEAYEFCATVRGETRFAKEFDYELVAQHKLQQQSADYDQSNSSTLQSDTNPWPGLE